MNHKNNVFCEMFAFAESLKRREIKLISPNTNISLLSNKALAPISDNMLQSSTMPTLRQTVCVTTEQYILTLRDRISQKNNNIIYIL